MKAREFVTDEDQDQNLARQWLDWHKKSVKGFKDFIEKHDLDAAAIKILAEFVKAARNTDPQIDPRSQHFRELIQEPLYYQLARQAYTKPRQQDFWRKPENFQDLELDFNLAPKPEPEESRVDLVRKKAEQEKHAQAWALRLAQAREDSEKPDELDRDLAQKILEEIKDSLGDRYESVVARIEQELETAAVVPESMTSREAADNILISSEDSDWFPMIFGRRVDPRLALIAVKRAPEVITEIDEDLRTPTLWLAAIRAKPNNMYLVSSIKPESLRNEIIKSLGLEEKWQEHQQWLQRRRGRLN